MALIFPLCVRECWCDVGGGVSERTGDFSPVLTLTTSFWLSFVAFAVLNFSLLGFELIAMFAKLVKLG